MKVSVDCKRSHGRVSYLPVLPSAGVPIVSV